MHEPPLTVLMVDPKRLDAGGRSREGEDNGHRDTHLAGDGEAAGHGIHAIGASLSAARLRTVLMCRTRRPCRVSAGEDLFHVHERRQFVAKAGWLTLEGEAAVGELPALVTNWLDPGLLMTNGARAAHLKPSIEPIRQERDTRVARHP